MKLYIIILNGAKGAGKSSLSEELRSQLEGVAFFGLDVVRRMMSGIHASNETNAIAVDAMFGMVEGFLSNKVSILIDGGISSSRLERIESIANKYNARIYSYTLNAPREILWSRVQERDRKYDKQSNRERFDYVYDFLEENVLPDTVKFDTSVTSTKQMSESILKDIQHNK